MSPRAKTSEPDAPATIPCRPAGELINAGEAASLVEQRAEQIDERIFPAFLFSTLKGSVGDQIDPEVYQAWVKKQLRESGSPRDPIERLLVEQVLLAHQHVCILTNRSTTSKSAKDTAAYATAVARLQAEIRRTSLALKEYRQAAGGRSFKVMSDEEHNEPPIATSAG